MKAQAAQPRLASAAQPRSDAPVYAESKAKAKPKILKGILLERTADGGWHAGHQHTHYEHDRGYKFGPTEGERAASHVARHIGLPFYSKRMESETEKETETTPRALAQEEYT
jgi:hypothetical protein